MEICNLKDHYSYEEYNEILEQLLVVNKTISIPTKGYSMWPTIKDGEKVVIQRLSRPVREGMVIVVKADDNNLVHRIMKKDGDIIITRGDANSECDLAFTVSDVLAEVVPFNMCKRFWRFLIKTIWHLRRWAINMLEKIYVRRI